MSRRKLVGVVELHHKEGGPGEHPFLTQSTDVPVTTERPVALDADQYVQRPGLARFNQAADRYHPDGTPGAPMRTVLQQHVDFFDTNKDGVIQVWETYEGFRRLGFNMLLSFLAIFVIHPGFSLATNQSWFPIDPMFRIWIDQIHHCVHGSDTKTFDNEGRFIPQNFENIWTKWDKNGDDRLHLWDLLRMTEELREVLDWFGWFAAKFEWGIVWLLCADRDGMVTREQIRGIYDGSFFYQVEQQVEEQRKKQQW